MGPIAKEVLTELSHNLIVAGRVEAFKLGQELAKQSSAWLALRNMLAGCAKNAPALVQIDVDENSRDYTFNVTGSNHKCLFTFVSHLLFPDELSVGINSSGAMKMESASPKEFRAELVKIFSTLGDQDNQI